jgi:hypothetical protein
MLKGNEPLVDANESMLKGSEPLVDANESMLKGNEKSRLGGTETEPNTKHPYKNQKPGNSGKTGFLDGTFYDRGNA